MDENAPRLVTRGQLFLLVFLALCIALHPGLVFKRDESGMSNYGIHFETAIPYSLGLLCASLYSLRAAALIRSSNPLGIHFRLVLRLFALVMVLVLLSTYGYKLNTVLDDLHVVANALTAVFETAATVWMFLSFNARRTMTIPLATELTGAALVAATTTNSLHLLFLAEVLLGVGFGISLVQAGRSLADRLN